MTKTTTKRQRKKRLRAEDPLAALRKAMRRLDKEQGVVARRNARSAVFAEMRRCKAFVDREFPVKRTKVKKRMRRVGKSLFNHLCKNGWAETNNRNLLAAASEAGIKARRVAWRNAGSGTEVTRTLLPDWVEPVWGLPNSTVSRLRKARRSKLERDALLMEAHFLDKKAANSA